MRWSEGTGVEICMGPMRGTQKVQGLRFRAQARGCWGQGRVSATLRYSPSDKCVCSKAEAPGEACTCDVRGRDGGGGQSLRQPLLTEKPY